MAREIAAILGVSRSYASALSSDDPLGEKARARKRSYSGTCIDCGAPTDGSNGRAKAPERCSPCRHVWEIANKKWTREAVIAAIQRFAREHGRPPVATDWNHSGRGEGYPPTSGIYRSHSNPGASFVSWADAIEAAGFPRPRSGVYVRTPEIRARIGESQRKRFARERQAA